MSELTFLYVHNRAMGYGRLGMDLAEALKKEGVTVYDDLGDRPDDSIAHSEVPVASGHTRSPHGPTNVVSWVSTPGHAEWWWKGQYTSVFTMWEADNLPAAFRDTIHNIDLLVVPSMQNVELFSRWHKNVKYVPLGVDTERWHYVPRQDPGQFFNFLIGGSGPRKGTDLAFHAFRKVFGDWKGKGPIPKLTMKSPRGESKFRGYDRIEMVSGKITDQEEQDLYATAHCYIQPSRGEGFGLQPLQAMAQGCPTILTDAHGHESFAKYATHPIGYSMTKADYFIFGDTYPPMQWWEPDFEQLCEAMWDVYHNYEPHRAAAEQVAKNVIPRDFTWDLVARRFVDAHDGMLDLPYAGDGTHLTPDILKFKVQVLRAHEADIAGHKHFWFPNTVYSEPADTKRLLFEAGVLDPVCIQGDDHGLSDAQVEQIGAYTAAKEWCPTCHQQLNTGIQKADVIFDGMPV